ncbi:hypothetical protein JCM6882_001016 [Rhodosporidiobolus microsporus]
MVVQRGSTGAPTVSDLVTYTPGELDEEDPVSLIEPLSQDSLDALNRLARHKPPEDPYPFSAGRSAVLVALFGSRSGRHLNVLLSTRSASLRTHPGQVALPGGKMDDTDINLEATARREAFEEVGLPIDTTRIRYLTALPPFLARSMMLVTPIVCFVLDYSLKPELNPTEVSDLFSFPLEAFLTADPHHPLFHAPFPPSAQSGEVPYHYHEDYPWFDGRPHRFHSFQARPQPVTGLTAEILIHVAMVAYGRSPDYPLHAPLERPRNELIERAIHDPKWEQFRRKWDEKKREEGEEGKETVKGKLVMAKLEEASSATIPQPLQAAAQELKTLAEQLKGVSVGATDWTRVAKAGKTLADNLRSEDLRTALGQAGLGQAVGAVLKEAVRAKGEGGAELSARTEMARVVGNLCFEHDENRQQCLDAGVPSSLAALLSAQIELVEEEVVGLVEQQRVLSVEELKFVRATVGALLNMSLKFDPVRRELATRPILLPLLALLDSRTNACKRTAPVYTVGCWAVEPTGDVDEWEERVQIGSMILSWTVNILQDVLGESKAQFPSSGILSLSSPILSIYRPSPASHPARPVHFTGEDASDHLDTDIEILSICAALLEGVVIDLDATKETLAFSPLDASSAPSSLLRALFTFIKSASPPPYWSHATDDAARTEKAFSTVKAAVVRAVVEAPNADRVMDRVWGETREGTEGKKERSWVVEEMVRWLREAGAEGEEGKREDMVICAAHVLAALGRKDEYTESLVHTYGLAAPLARIVQARVDQLLASAAAAKEQQGRPGETTQVLFGVVSLLRHLAIPVKNRQVVGETGIIPSVALLLRKELDIVGPLQLSSIGLLKHLSANHVPNSLDVLAIPPPAPDAERPAPSSSPDSIPLDHVLALIARTDDTRLRSEATRIVVNLVRSLWSSKPAIAHHHTALSQPPAAGSAAEPPAVGEKHLDDEELLRQQGRELLAGSADVARVLSELVRLSEKYAVLVNEGVVGLALLAGSGGEAASHVLSALVENRHTPLPSSAASPDPPSAAPPSAIPPALQQQQQPEQKRSTSLSLSPAGDPPTAADMLASWIGLVASATLAASSSSSSTTAPAGPGGVRVEMVANAVALVVAVLQHLSPSAAGAEQRQKGVDALRAKVVGPLQGARERLGAAATDGAEGLRALVGRACEVVENKQ